MGLWQTLGEAFPGQGRAFSSKSLPYATPQHLASLNYTLAHSRMSSLGPQHRGCLTKSWHIPLAVCPVSSHQELHPTPPLPPWKHQCRQYLCKLLARALHTHTASDLPTCTSAELAPEHLHQSPCLQPSARPQQGSLSLAAEPRGCLTTTEQPGHLPSSSITAHLGGHKACFWQFRNYFKHSLGDVTTMPACSAPHT